MVEFLETKSVRGIGGWLLVYVVLAALGIVIMLYQSLMDLLLGFRMPPLFPSMAGTALLVIIWYLVYAVLLYQLVMLRRGAVARIKKMLVATLFFNALLPVPFSAILSLTVQDVSFVKALCASYAELPWANLLGMAVMCVVWYRYFSLSRRVRQTFPEEYRA